jgi:hypothetical protein
MVAYSIPSDFITFKKYFASSPSSLAAADRFPCGGGKRLQD